MTFPPGEWSFLLVGGQWPYDEDLAALSRGKLNRGQIKTGFIHFADLLLSAQTGPLSQQGGYTADDLRHAFSEGEKQAREVAEKNGIKENAYGTAYDSMVSLQHALTNLADEGNKQIKEIQDSKQPVETKVPQIVEAIHRYRAQANIVAAKYGGNVADAMQNILNADMPGQSARQFAQAHGLEIGQMFRGPNQENLPEQVKGLLNSSQSPSGLTPGLNTPPPTIQGQEAPASSTLPPGINTPPSTIQGQVTPAVSGSPPRLVPGLNRPPAPAVSPIPAAPAPTAGPIPGAPSLPHAGGSAPGVPMTGGGSPSMPSAPASPLAAGAPTAPASPVQPVNPADLMHSFDKGMQAGTPLSATAAAMPPPQPTDPQIPTNPTAGAGSVPVSTPAYEPAPVAHAAAPDATPAPQVVAGSASPAAAAPAPAGPLPAYASDIRPAVPAASAPVLPSSPPPSAMASSAPVHPSAGQGNPPGPAMVRQTPPPAPPSSPSSLGTEAVAATATGAVAGAASANATERARLERLVSAVARQQPRLAWAAGDRPDETTVLTTDLASGWIPPGIELPAVVTLLSPERRRGDIETLLGEVTVATGYTPIHHVPEEDEPVPTSPRPRRLPDIDELGWELNQATQWRDGLPRLAHTLAKAATSGTGVLDKEVDLLQTHLREISARVLDSYPDNVDLHEVGNWQLLAAIDALVADDKTSANYHLAWFQACSTTISQ